MIVNGSIEPFIGDTLPNGATVIAYTRTREGGDSMLPGGVVLANRGHQYFDPFVTWDVAISDDDSVSTFSGHYFTSIVEAAVDYEARGGR